LEETIQYLQIITDVIVILLFIGILIAVYHIVKVLKLTSVKFGELSEQTKDIKLKLEPAIEKIEKLTENVNGVINTVKDNIDILGGSVQKVKSAVDDLIELEQKVQSKIEPPLLDTANTISAVSVGLKTFFENYKNSRKKINSDKEFEPQFIEQTGQNATGNENAELEHVNEKLKDLQS